MLHTLMHHRTHISIHVLIILTVLIFVSCFQTSIFALPNPSLTNDNNDHATMWPKYDCFYSDGKRHSVQIHQRSITIGQDYKQLPCTMWVYYKPASGEIYTDGVYVPPYPKMSGDPSQRVLVISNNPFSVDSMTHSCYKVGDTVIIEARSFAKCTYSVKLYVERGRGNWELIEENAVKSKDYYEDTTAIVRYTIKEGDERIKAFTLFNLFPDKNGREQKKTMSCIIDVGYERAYLPSIMVMPFMILTISTIIALSIMIIHRIKRRIQILHNTSQDSQ